MILALATVLVASQQTIRAIDEDFAGQTRLHAVSGDYAVGKADYVCRNTDTFDNIAFHNAYLTGRYTLTVNLTHRSAIRDGAGGGLVFACPRPDRMPRFGQVLRFDGADHVVVGHFMRGTFVLDRRLALREPIAEDESLVLMIDIDEAAASLRIHVGETLVADGIPLRFTGGHAGVHASKATIAFHRLSADQDPEKEPRLRWPDRLLPSHDDDAFLVASRRDRATFRFAADGSAPSPAPRTDPIAGRPPRARISGERVVLDNGAVFTARDAGGIEPVDLLRLTDDRLFVLDLLGPRILEVPADGDPALPKLTFDGDRVALDPPTAATLHDEDGTQIGETDAAGYAGPLRAGQRYQLQRPITYTVLPGPAPVVVHRFVAPAQPTPPTRRRRPRRGAAHRRATKAQRMVGGGRQTAGGLLSARVARA